MKQFDKTIDQIIEERKLGIIPAGILSAALLAGTPTSSSSTSTPDPIVQMQQQDYVQRAKNIIKKHEGTRNKVYTDTKGHPTIGIGFNLDRNDADTILTKVGASKPKVLAGEALSDDQVDRIFTMTFEEATKAVKQLVPTFESLPDNVKIVLLDMMFNMGPNKLQQFEKFLTAVKSNNFTMAAKEMVNSKWYNQVGNRSIRLAKLMKGEEILESFQMARIKQLKGKQEELAKARRARRPHVGYMATNSPRAEIMNGPNKVGVGRGLNATV